MNIYSPSQEDMRVFESLKRVIIDESILEPAITIWPKGELHPMWGTKRPDLSARNSLLKGSKWNKDIPHFNLGKKASEETKKKMSEARKLKKISEETKKKMSESAKIRMSDPAHKALIASKRKIKVTIDGIEYESIKQAKETLCLTYRQVRALLEASQ